MPLLDHFHPPLSRTHPWRSFHGAWAAAIARLLNAGELPDGYHAAPFLDRDAPMKIDGAALKDPTDSIADEQGWEPRPASLSIAVEWPELDNVSVEVLWDEGEPRLVGAIELVSPSNKDRPRARKALAGKCAGHLRNGRGLIIVDVVTTRRADLQADLFAAIGVDPPNACSGLLSAVAYRAVAGDVEGQLLIWPAALAVGQPLPTLPLWLDVNLAVPVDLEASHSMACVDLRIRGAE